MGLWVAWRAGRLQVVLGEDRILEEGIDRHIARAGVEPCLLDRAARVARGIQFLLVRITAALAVILVVGAPVARLLGDEFPFVLTRVTHTAYLLLQASPARLTCSCE